MKRIGAFLFLIAINLQLSAAEVKIEYFKIDGNFIEAKQTIQVNQFPKVIENEVNYLSAIPETNVFPRNGNTVTLTLTLNYDDGAPASGIPISVSSQAYTLTGAEWRTKTGLSARFGASAQTVINRIDSGLLRLQSPLNQTSGLTDANGSFSVVASNFHVCGNESTPGSDLITIAFSGGNSQFKINCVVPDL